MSGKLAAFDVLVQHVANITPTFPTKWLWRLWSDRTLQPMRQEGQAFCSILPRGHGCIAPCQENTWVFYIFGWLNCKYCRTLLLWGSMPSLVSMYPRYSISSAQDCQFFCIDFHSCIPKAPEYLFEFFNMIFEAAPWDAEEIVEVSS